MNRLKTFGIIPARYASTRFPGKPLVRLQDRSMIEWVYKRASQAFDIVAVATDDDRIAEEVKHFGGQVVMTSPLHKSGTDRCAEALERLQLDLGEQADVIVNVQGDEPFVDPGLLVPLAESFQDECIQIATVVKPIRDPDELFNPNCVKVVISASGKAIYFSRATIPYLRGCDQAEWTCRHNYFKHLGLYAYRADVLRRLTHLPQSSLEIAESLEQNRWLENDYLIRVIQTEKENIAIDTPDDLTKAQQWLTQNHISF